MKTLLIVVAIIVLAFILKSCISGNNKAEESPRPPDDKKATNPVENDKIIIVKNVSQTDLTQALIKFCNVYNRNDFAAQPRLFKIDETTFAVTFPYDVSFDIFCFAVNFLKYPMDIKWNADVKGWATTNEGDPWITDKSVNKKVMLFLAVDDKECDNVFLTTNDNIGYKLGFAMGEESQLLNTPKEQFEEPWVDYKSLKELKYEDFD